MKNYYKRGTLKDWDEVDPLDNMRHVTDGPIRRQTQNITNLTPTVNGRASSMTYFHSDKETTKSLFNTNNFENYQNFQKSHPQSRENEQEKST